MKRRWIMIIAIVGILLVGTLAGPLMSNVETPNYTVLDQQNKIELRQYEPMIIAEVQVEGEQEDAVGDGFRLLADYIFGNNTIKKDINMTAPVQQQKNAKIAMTVPVQQQSTKIAMTAPVQQQSEAGEWRVSFVMPSEYTMETLPKPVNPKVTLKQIPSKTFVVIRFSGRGIEPNIQKNEAKLRAYISDKKLSVIEPPKYAFYSTPWTVPFMKRNEVMFQIR